MRGMRRLVAGALLLTGFTTCAALADAAAVGMSAVPGAARAETTEPTAVDDVVIGAYIQNIQSIGLATNSFQADVYVWMRWKNPALKPYESLEIMNPYETWALTSTPITAEPVPQPDGSQYYAIRYQGGFNTPLDLTEFPFGEQVLTIQLEDQVSEAKHQRFVLDKDSIANGPQITVPGYDIGTATIDVVDATYATNFGDLNTPGNDVYSRVTISIPVAHPFLSTAVKILLPILLVVVTASLIFHVPPGLVEARIGLGITALLTLVAMQWSTLSGLADLGYLVMLDVLYIVAYFFVVATLIQSLVTSWKARAGDEAGAIRIDERSMYVDLAAYLIITGAVMWYYLH